MAVNNILRAGSGRVLDATASATTLEDDPVAYSFCNVSRAINSCVDISETLQVAKNGLGLTFARDS